MVIPTLVLLAVSIPSQHAGGCWSTAWTNSDFAADGKRFAALPRSDASDGRKGSVSLSKILKSWLVSLPEKCPRLLGIHPQIAPARVRTSYRYLLMTLPPETRAQANFRVAVTSS